MIQLFKQREGFRPERVYAMADIKHDDQVKFSALIDTLGKMMPNLTREFLDNIPPVFGVEYDQAVSQKEWLLLFEFQASGSVGPKSSATKRQNDLKKEQAEDLANKAVLKYLYECLEKEDMTPKRLFGEADKKFRGVIDINELKDLLKKILPEAFL